MASLRKYPKLLPSKRGPIVTLDRTLLAAVVGLVGFGALETGGMTVASNDTPTPGASDVMTASRQTADFTPVGSIEKTTDQKQAPAKEEGKTLPSPFGLRWGR